MLYRRTFPSPKCEGFTDPQRGTLKCGCRELYDGKATLFRTGHPGEDAGDGEVVELPDALWALTVLHGATNDPT